MNRKAKRKIEESLRLAAESALAAVNARADALEAVCTQAAVDAVRAELDAIQSKRTTRLLDEMRMWSATLGPREEAK